jgi:hypothetical protein
MYKKLQLAMLTIRSRIAQSPWPQGNVLDEEFPCLQNTQAGSGIEQPPAVGTGSASLAGKWPACGDAHWVRND